MNMLIKGALAASCPFLLSLPGTTPAFAQDVVVEERYERRVISPDEGDIGPDDDAIEVADDTAVVVDGGMTDAVARCAARYRSFDPTTGTYVSYDGAVRTCRYLN